MSFLTTFHTVNKIQYCTDDKISLCKNIYQPINHLLIAIHSNITILLRN